MKDLKRNIENKINKLLDIFPAVVILGTRQCGKTSLSKVLRPKWGYFDLEVSSTYDRISRDITFFLKENSTHIIIDEAQVYPQIFNELRGVIDSDRKKNNRFIITGSSSPELMKHVSESLAGRVAIVELSPLKLNEVLEKPLSSFYGIFENKITANTLQELKELKAIANHSEVKNHLLKGGYPDATLSSDQFTYDQWMDNYFATYINRDIRSLFPKMDLVKFRRFIQMMTTISGTVINKSNISRAIEVSDKTIKDYIDIAHGTFIWRKIHSFEKNITKSIIKMPKGGFRDSGLLHFQKGIRTIQELDNSQSIGNDFEHYVTEEILRGINAGLATNWDYNYYRTRAGAEVDLVLSGSFGVLPIEIKYGIKTSQKALISLKSFIKEHNLPFGIVINNSDKIEMLSEQIIQIPVNFL